MTLHVEVRGRGPDVVLLHGWALHGKIWGPWLEGLAGVATLHIVDLPGHGCSDWPAATDDLAGLAKIVATRVPQGAVLLGWSLGGMIALELARQLGGRIAGLILMATTPRFVAGHDWPHGVPDAMLEDFALQLQADYRRTVQNFLALQTRGDERAHSTLRTMRQHLAHRPPPAPEALTTGLAILRAADLRPATRSIQTPALVISGGHDRLTPAAAGVELARLLPNARHVLLARAAHTPFLSHSVEVLQEVLEFLGAAERATLVGATG